MYSDIVQRFITKRPTINPPQGSSEASEQPLPSTPLARFYALLERAIANTQSPEALLQEAQGLLLLLAYRHQFVFYRVAHALSEKSFAAPTPEMLQYERDARDIEARLELLSEPELPSDAELEDESDVSVTPMFISTITNPPVYRHSSNEPQSRPLIIEPTGKLVIFTCEYYPTDQSKPLSLIIKFAIDDWSNLGLQNDSTSEPTLFLLQNSGSEIPATITSADANGSLIVQIAPLTPAREWSDVITGLIGAVLKGTVLENPTKASSKSVSTN